MLKVSELVFALFVLACLGAIAAMPLIYQYAIYHAPPWLATATDKDGNNTPIGITCFITGAILVALLIVCLACAEEAGKKGGRP